MDLRLKLFALVVLVLFVCSAVADDVIWLDKPAVNWEKEAFPLGNGRLGCKVFGGVEQERIQFNVDSLWTGDENLGGDYGKMGAFQDFGSLYIELDAKAEVSNYKRSLNLGTAVNRVSYVQDGTEFLRETFCSNPHQIIVSRMTANKKGKYSGRIKLVGAHKETSRSTNAIGKDSGWLTFTGSLENDMDYVATVYVAVEGGSVQAEEGGILVFSGCDKLTIKLSAETSYVMDYSKKWKCGNLTLNSEILIIAAIQKKYQDMLKFHIKDHQLLYNRLEVDFGDTGNAQLALPIDQRLAAIRNGVADPDMDELLMQYGRYLLIACSRPGTLPANLQGLWASGKIPWHGDYHSNINLQMNYWLAETANLAECHLPLFDMLTESIEPFRKGTKLSFGEDIRGFTIRTSHNPFGGMGWKWNLPASAWYGQHFWEHYAFGRDKKFLKTVAYPYLKEVCNYWEDHLNEMPDGRLVVPNGWSPEHGPHEDGCSYDQQVVWDLFTNTIDAANELGVDSDYSKKLTVMRDKLVGPQIGKWGQLQEWMADKDDPNDNHRHVSHMFAVYPGRQISVANTPEFAKAAKVSLKARGVGKTVGWANAWKTALWARLLDGETAYSYYHKEVTDNAFSNLWNGCWPGRCFQIDANFGITAGGIEMLLQSHAGEIHLLPALPDAWATGSVRGLRARGGITVDIRWKDGELVSATFYSRDGADCTISYKGMKQGLKIDADKRITISGKDIVENKDELTGGSFPGKKSSWNNFDKYDFTVDGRRCMVITPKAAAKGRPWIWRARFFGHEPQTDIALLDKGFHVVYMDVANLFGCPAAVAHWDAFYDYLTKEHNLSAKPALEGMSRGGLIIYNWAAANPEKVACIYGDAPVCDFKSWPAGLGKSNGDRRAWQACLKAYGLTHEESLKYKRNPIDNLEPLAKAGIPLLNVCGEADKTVPVDENSIILKERYEKLDGKIKLILKSGIGHHPHSLKDPMPIVKFILANTLEEYNVN